MNLNIATLIALTAGLSALDAESDTAPASSRKTGTAQRAKPSTPLVVAGRRPGEGGVGAVHGPRDYSSIQNGKVKKTILFVRDGP